MDIKKYLSTLPLALTSLASLLVSVPLYAEEDRWFEVELFIFSRDDSKDPTTEVFAPQLNPILINHSRDLISDVLYPEMAVLRQNWLPECETKPQVLPKVPLAAFGINQLAPELISQTEAKVNIASQVEINSELLNLELAAYQQSQQALLALNEVVEPSSLSQAGTELVSEITAQTDSLAESEETEQSGLTSETLASYTFPVDQPSWHYPALCQKPEPSLLTQERALIIAQELDLHWDKTPIKVTSFVDEYSEVPYLLSEDKLEFNKAVAKFRWRKELTPLIHLAWRQPVKAQNEETPWRIYAGKNYSKDFHYNGEPIEKTLEPIEVDTEQAETELVTESQTLNHQSILDNIQNVLSKIDDKTWDVETAQSQKQKDEWQIQQTISGTPDNVWQLDGLFKIYLRHYLFIETEFNIREITDHPAEQDEEILEQSIIEQANIAPNAASVSTLAEPAEKKAYLHPYYFQQNRRIRSGEVHYFDHPKMGIVLQVRRYTRPDKPEEEFNEEDIFPSN
ncbi:CsiV family protein [Catenovulum maritimum]|uniref:Peptidoglycan-binding protein n=1 Tax=Catenovulum maritimum TaxID=1513271 RepID=A0A0J8GQ77_9ALTE|nr:CsiV family protein [Catenovulum maritimum]KMT64930.1 hypothetical protein XM47_12025 [Catenovulum maritimum]